MTDALHLKDSDETGQHTPLGQGAGDCQRILDDAVARGWSGPVTLEPHLKVDAGGAAIPHCHFLPSIGIPYAKQCGVRRKDSTALVYLKGSQAVLATALPGQVGSNKGLAHLSDSAVFQVCRRPTY
jgi:hypothetical protein